MILDKLFEKRAETYNPQHPKDPGLIALFGGGTTTSAGVAITPDNATQINAVYASIGILADSIASLPLFVYERLDEGGKRQARTHPNYTRLHDQPNRWQTSFEWREMMIGHCALRGNAYSHIVSSGNNPVTELVPLHPDHVMPFWSPDKSIAYYHTPVDDKPRVLLQSEVHHLRLRTTDGLKGISPIDECRESLGLASATEKFGASFFSNGANPGGVLEHPGKMGEEPQQRLKKAWAERHQGVGKSHKIAILEEGMQYKQLGVAPEQAQFLETRKFQISEIARIFRIPPHMLADLERATFSNIEEQSLEFVKYTLTPWLVRWEQAMLRDLFSERSRRRFFPEFNVDGLLRGDSKSRAEFYSFMQDRGNMSVNEVREKENLNPIPGGDKHMVPLNMTTLDKLGENDDSGTQDV